MKLVLHGDNTTASRQRLREIINQHKSQGIKDIISLDGEKITTTDLHQALESTSLFGSTKLVVIEKLFSRPKSKEKDILVNLFKEDNSNNSVILWENKEITKTHLNKLKQFTSELFKTPAVIFQFLDALRPNNTKNLIDLLHRSSQTEAIELVFYLLCRRVSDLIVALDKPDLLVQAPWLKGKLISQAKTFSLSNLLSLHQQLLDLDISQKTGTNILPLASELDLLLVTL